VAWETKTRNETFDSIFCSVGGMACGGYYTTGQSLPGVALESVGKPCLTCMQGTYVRSTGIETVEYRYQVCNRCTSDDCCERYSMGAYYSVLCDTCWGNSSVVGSADDDRPVDWFDAGETFEGESDLF
jgi:hypothetical protein